MIRIKNALVMPMTDGIAIEKGEVWTEGDKVAFVGQPDAKKFADTRFEREIDADGGLVMPSFKNAHTHSAMTFLRSYADDLPLQEWLFNKIFPMEAKLTGDHIYWLSKLAILEYLTSGVTASFDMYFEPDAYVKANIESGFRTVLCGSIAGEPSNLDRLDGYMQKFNGISPLISYRLGFHAEYTASYELLEGMAELAKKYRQGVSTHNSETAKEVRECIEKYGKTPTELFDSLGLFEFGGSSFHCVHLSDNDISIFRDRGLYAVTCPGSNSKLASGIAPIVKMHDAGVKLAVGTDGPSSNNCLDMFREMFLMTALQKLKLDDAAACPAQWVLEAATTGSAHAMGLEDCDNLAEGKQADLIIIDLNQPNMQPLNSIANNIVYSGSKQNVMLTMCAGKVLYERGEFNIGTDPREIYAKANEIITSMS
ncbi:5-methylthioadenosine/S-adenosylhomocysteine deaminase [Ruminococcus sp. YE71]|uniref:amidohydrolase family protein n=1 Tax=unclassified Ruminococcus TaxID=2608920 RepID=UPI00088415E5|nr:MULTISPECIES: amidohydrolase [unclassified Ruminococcus]SDA22005.1 5-methylthioadenosine/S-adenosylhomocysteine deaminase [Ruminococcus sp. YE78]SFW37274.1 5-methylthioadenosine/S-adenosylhomocysteine deaminase [Ruminococcus sp. YE71]